MNVVPGPAVTGALTLSITFPLLLMSFAHGPLRVPRSGARYQLAAVAAIILFALWCALYPGARSPADVVAGALMISGAMIIWFNIWSILVWGFTLSLLTALAEAHAPLTKERWIAAYTGISDASVFAHDRLGVLLKLKAARIERDQVRMTVLGRLIALGGRLARLMFGMR